MKLGHKDDNEDEQIPNRANLSENSSDSSDNEIFSHSSPSNQSTLSSLTSTTGGSWKQSKGFNNEWLTGLFISQMVCFVCYVKSTIKVNSQQEK